MLGDGERLRSTDKAQDDCEMLLFVSYQCTDLNYTRRRKMLFYLFSRTVPMLRVEHSIAERVRHLLNSFLAIAQRQLKSKEKSRKNRTMELF